LLKKYSHIFINIDNSNTVKHGKQQSITMFIVHTTKIQIPKLKHNATKNMASVQQASEKIMSLETLTLLLVSQKKTAA